MAYDQGFLWGDDDEPDVMSSRYGNGEWESLFTDGGTVGKNPSPYGATWAFVTVDAGKDVRVHDDCGVITPGQFNWTHVSNNLAELYALVMGLNHVPPGWSGTLYTDSNVTIQRVRMARGGKRRGCVPGVPSPVLEEFYAAVNRAGHFMCVLLAGHPDRHQLACCRSQMVYRDPATGLAYSRHNDFVDKACSLAARDWLSP